MELSKKSKLSPRQRDAQVKDTPTKRCMKPQTRAPPLPYAQHSYSTMQRRLHALSSSTTEAPLPSVHFCALPSQPRATPESQHSAVLAHLTPLTQQPCMACPLTALFFTQAGGPASCCHKPVTSSFTLPFFPTNSAISRACVINPRRGPPGQVSVLPLCSSVRTCGGCRQGGGLVRWSR